MHRRRSPAGPCGGLPPAGATRRVLLRMLAAGPWAALAVPAGAAAAPRTLRLAHLHTGETLSLAYHEGGHYVDGALAAVNRLLRDFRTGEVAAIDPRLLDLLHAVATATGSARPFEVVSAYRSAATNAALRRAGGGVAATSLHLQGRAIDVRLGDVPLAALRDAALALRGGGVGYYPGSNFVHVDTGRVRAW